MTPPDVEYQFEIWQGDECVAMGSAPTSYECGDESAHYAMMYGQDGPVTVRFYERREITETSPQPVTPAGGEVCPSLWVADALVDSCRLLGDAATVHRVMVATKPQAQYTKPLYTHPPVADAALAELIEADKAFKSATHALATTPPQSEDAETMESMYAHRNRCFARREAAIAALNQRGGGDHG